MAPWCIRVLFRCCKQITRNKNMSEQDAAPKHMQTEGEGRGFQPGLGFRLALITNPNIAVFLLVPALSLLLWLGWSLF